MSEGGDGLSVDSVYKYIDYLYGKLMFNVCCGVGVDGRWGNLEVTGAPIMLSTGHRAISREPSHTNLAVASSGSGWGHGTGSLKWNNIIQEIRLKVALYNKWRDELISRELERGVLYNDMRVMPPHGRSWAGR